MHFYMRVCVYNMSAFLKMVCSHALVLNHRASVFFRHYPSLLTLSRSILTIF